jgi:FlgD Ig-like domain
MRALSKSLSRGNGFRQSLLFLIPVCLLFASPARAVLPEIIGVIKCDTNYTLFGNEVIGLGDQNGDGFADILIWDYQYIAKVFYGGTAISGVPGLSIVDVLPPMLAIDIDKNGIKDIALRGRPSYGRKINLYFGGTQLDSLRDLWFGLDSPLPGTSFCIGDEIHGGGTKGIWSSSLPNLQSALHFPITSTLDSVHDRVIFPPSRPFSSLVADGIISNDFNGDGYPDLAFNVRGSWADSANGSVLFYFGGSTFDTLPDMYISRPGAYRDCFEDFGKVLVDLGDFNGDGFNDFYVGHGQSCDTVGFVYFGGPGLDTIPDIIIPDHTYKAVNAGDINDDGYPDLMTSLFIASSSYSYVNIYYGGPTTDSIPDLVINVSDAPGYNIVFGMGIAGLGDVNGDGIDDYAVASQDDFGFGQVYVFAGKSSGSSVRPRHETSLPTTITLQQNYPNPFNPSTTIAFDIPSKANVSMTIMNILGEIVRTLIDQPMLAGSYEVDWDGADNSGHLVSSGVYLYRLSTDNEMRTGKMMLIK